MKNCLRVITFGAGLLFSACTTANADTDLEWTHNNNQGEAKNHVAEEINNLDHTPQEAVDKINSLYEGTVVEVELDGDDGVYYYEIEIVNGDIRYDSKVGADNLEVLKLEKGDADSDDPLNSVKRITPEAALDIADDEVDGEITGWELEDDEYEILIEADDELIKIEIDALTADILDKTVQKDEKKKDKIDGSGSKGEKESDDKKARNKKPEEQLKNKDSKSEKTGQQDAKDAEEKEKSEPAGNKDGAEKQEKTEQKETKETVEKEVAEPEEESAGQSADQTQKSDETAETSDYQNGILTAEAAINIALNQVGGIVIEWEYDEEDLEYEIELNSNGQEVEMEISALNGAVLDIDHDD